MAVQTRPCAMYLCDEPLRSTHSNALYCSHLCRNRSSRLHLTGEISLKCPRCGGGDYIVLVTGEDSCLRCAYSAGEPLSLDGVRIVIGQYEHSA